jgi:phenylalanine-4-hydroxylase
METMGVELPTDHPGVSDPEYLRRRSTIADASRDHVAGSKPRTIEYTPSERAVWSTVLGSLSELHQSYATAEYRLTGWTVEAVPGLVPTRTFYAALANRTFLSTQYVRHPSVPFYTPEPDIIHELIGHINALASPRLASLHEAAGQASLRATTDAGLQRFSRVFWFTLEFGVTLESDQLRTYGAGLLSSYGEIQSFRDAEVRPFETNAMADQDYDITAFQNVLFGGASFDAVETVLLDYFASI